MCGVGTINPTNSLHPSQDNSPLSASSAARAPWLMVEIFKHHKLHVNCRSLLLIILGQICTVGRKVQQMGMDSILRIEHRGPLARTQQKSRFCNLKKDTKTFSSPRDWKLPLWWKILVNYWVIIVWCVSVVENIQDVHHQVSDKTPSCRLQLVVLVHISQCYIGIHCIQQLSSVFIGRLHCICGDGVWSVQKYNWI